MKINKILGITITAIAIVTVGFYVLQATRQCSMGGASKPIEDNRIQITAQQDVQYQSSVLINSIEKQSEYGTGYVIGKTAVATNRHVVLEVKDKPESGVVRIGHKDKDGKTLSDYKKIAEFGDSSKVKVGSMLTVVGFPGDKEYATMWAGTGEVDMVSDNMISFRAITAPGNSGSPLFDSEGKVVAMNNAGGDTNSFGFLLDDTILSFFRSHIE